MVIRALGGCFGRTPRGILARGAASQDQYLLNQALIQEHFFVYLEQTDQNDLFHPLNQGLPPLTKRIQETLETLHNQLKSTALAASTPLYIGLMGAFGGRSAALKALISKAQAGDSVALQAAHALLVEPNYGETIQESINALQEAHQRQIMPEAFQALLRQSTVMVWGAFETFADNLLKWAIDADINILQQLVATGTEIWGDKADKWHKKIKEQQQANPDLSVGEAYAIARTRMGRPVNLQSVQTLYKAMLAGNAQVDARLTSKDMQMLEARRHLFVHRQGVADEKYIQKTGDKCQNGAAIQVLPEELRRYFRAITHAGLSLAQAVEQII
ncbi:hypothetical protein F0U59_50030 [Archangium gephyra]|nr:hypothetical protein F0U59_50030 [Archangium gephyra]